VSTKTAVLGMFLPLPEGNDQYPVEFIETRGVIKLAEEPGRVIIGITEKTTVETKNSLANFHRKPIEFIEIDMTEISAYLGNKMGEADAEEKKDRHHCHAGRPAPPGQTGK